MSAVVANYIASAIDGFVKDPPDTEFQRGYLEALCVMATSEIATKSVALTKALESAEGLRHRPGKRRF